MPTLTNLLFLVLLIQGPIALKVAILHPVPRVLVRSPQFLLTFPVQSGGMLVTWCPSVL